jgi:hypothetical protein
MMTPNLLALLQATQQGTPVAGPMAPPAAPQTPAPGFRAPPLAFAPAPQLPAPPHIDPPAIAQSVGGLAGAVQRMASREPGRDPGVVAQNDGDPGYFLRLLRSLGL